jgi:hypothetical protein
MQWLNGPSLSMGAAHAGKYLGDTYLAIVETMKWVIIYLNVGLVSVIEGISHSTAEMCWPLTHMPAALAHHVVGNLGSACLQPL